MCFPAVIFGSLFIIIIHSIAFCLIYFLIWVGIGDVFQEVPLHFSVQDILGIISLKICMSKMPCNYFIGCPNVKIKIKKCFPLEFSRHYLIFLLLLRNLMPCWSFLFCIIFFFLILSEFLGAPFLPQYCEISSVCVLVLVCFYSLYLILNRFLQSGSSFNLGRF